MIDIPTDFLEPSENIVTTLFRRPDVEGPAAIIAGCTERAGFVSHIRAIYTKYPGTELINVDPRRADNPERLAWEAAATKRLHALLASHLMTAREVMARLRREGWMERSGKGSHVVLTKPGLRNVSVPNHPGDLSPGVLRSIARAAGWEWPPQR